MFRLDTLTFPAACYTEQSSGAGTARGTLSYLPRHNVKEGNVKPLWEGKKIQTQYGNNALWILNRVFLPRNDALDLGSDMNTERCNTQGCELQDTKILLQGWGEVRCKQQMQNSRVFSHIQKYINTDTQRSKVCVSVDCHPQMEQVMISSAGHSDSSCSEQPP